MPTSTSEADRGKRLPRAVKDVTALCSGEFFRIQARAMGLTLGSDAERKELWAQAAKKNPAFGEEISGLKSALDASHRITDMRRDQRPFNPYMYVGDRDAQFLLMSLTIARIMEPTDTTSVDFGVTRVIGDAEKLLQELGISSVTELDIPEIKAITLDTVVRGVLTGQVTLPKPPGATSAT